MTKLRAKAPHLRRQIEGGQSAYLGTDLPMSKKTSTETVKMTLYISKPVVKEFKKLAIDEEKDYSELATEALQFFIQEHQSPHSPPSR